ncbi:MAG: DNA replication and repair protein RecF [Victivallaceae bacterium]|nr:DNA replication and repair protein RecF [Victivallaceae bacterium]
MIKRLLLNNFRNYESAEITFSSRNIVFSGRNGQGKTNLLEALFFLSVLRSFRTSKTGDIKKIGCNSFYAAADVRKKKWAEFIEVKYSEGGKRRLSIDSSPVLKASEFINQIRVVVFSPDDINIVTSNSGIRRRFMDMLISVIDPFYLNALRDYGAALKNRNALLRDNKADLISMDAYEEIMAENCFKIIKERKKYTDILIKEVNRLLAEMGNGNIFGIRYRAEIKNISIAFFREKFKNERSRDFKRGFTAFGPQSDEFELFFSNILMRSFASAGQCRLISLCLKMAKLKILCESDCSDLENVLVLVDDVTGELDEIMRGMFFKVISRAGQAFFTFTEKPDFDFFKDCEYYNIVNGEVKKK